MAIPVSLDDAKRQLRIELDDDSRDTEIGGFISDAAAWVEQYTGHILAARDVTEQFRGFRSVKLRAWPIAVNALPAVAYVDRAGMPIGLSGARLDLNGRPARVWPASGIFWPFLDSLQSFTVTIRAGYENTDMVPGNIRRAMLVLISAYDADREGGDIFAKAEVTARRLCRTLKAQTL